MRLHGAPGKPRTKGFEAKNADIDCSNTAESLSQCGRWGFFCRRVSTKSDGCSCFAGSLNVCSPKPPINVADWWHSKPSTAPEVPLKTPSSSLIVQLCVYRLRLYPIWPIVAVEEIMGSLQGDVQDMETYALANAIGAATIAQLKLDQTGISTATGSSMAEECQRTKLMGKNGQSANLNMLRIAFFLHIYYENQDQGGVKSLLFLREAITIAQIMGLHRESSYQSLPPSEQQLRRRILWLLFVTERYPLLFCF